MRHYGRTHQQGRPRASREGLIEWEGKTVSILREDELAEIGDFSPDYLHLLKENGGIEDARSA